MKTSTIAALLVVAAEAIDKDLFNYGFSDVDLEGGGTAYGQQNWDKVTCDDLETCSGYPDKMLNSEGFSVAGSSNCMWCPQNGPQNCGLHRQSPINLERNRAIIGDPMEKECPDWHFMHTQEGSCTWDDMLDQFAIERHALTLKTPVQSDGQVACVDSEGLRRFPRADYSKGFPDWWWLDHISLQVPSQHTQEGKRYDAELSFHHFYEIAHPKNQLGSISVFLNAYDDTAPWPMLDKLICQWRKVEEEARSSCGLEPSPPYGRCALFRDQEPTDEWTSEANGEVFAYTPSKITPTISPVAAVNETEAPFAALGGTIEPTMHVTTGYPTTLSLTSAPMQSLTGSPTDSGLNGTVATDSSTTTGPSDSSPWWQSWGRPDGVFPTPTMSPTSATTQVSNTADIPPPIECSAYSAASIERMCASSQPCCESTRSETTFCWDIYENIFPGLLINSACYHCCNTPKFVGKSATPLPKLQKTVQCSKIDSPYRICKPNSCCVNPRSTSSYCTEIYDQFGDDMEQICHYCCAESQKIGPTLRRNLRRVDQEGDFRTASSLDMRSANAYGRNLALGPENHAGIIDENAYYDHVKKYQKRRLQEGSMAHEEDYKDVEYGTYDPLIESGTEYYFRYEGTQLVAPCRETVHWRILKDPIRLNHRQVAELNRLLAWRISTSGSNRCEIDTAGRLSNDGNSVDLSREPQYHHLLHREVFCQCNDWPSKFEADKQWCEGWQQNNGADRFYNTPYNFDTDGKW